jgi:cytochrome b561/polyisoprenoid-binding protein YceI
MTPDRYSSTAKFFHWSIALALAFQLALGWRLEDLPKGPIMFAGFQLHKSVGITILLLSLGRLALRRFSPPPPLMGDSAWAVRLAKGVHHLLYVVMIGAPITGWILVSTAKIKVPTLLFGTVPWPHLPVPGSWHEPSEGLHSALALGGLALFILHVGGALRHQFFKGENILGRMVPFLSGHPISKGKAAFVALLLLALMWLAHGAGWQIPLGPPAEQSPTADMSPTKLPTHAPPAPKVSLAAADEGEGDEPINAQAAAPAVAGADAVARLPLSSWQIAPGGRLGFRASWSGTPVNGYFGSWSPTIRFSPDELSKSSIEAKVNLASANTGDSQRDESLHGADFFDTAIHPAAIFRSTSIVSKGADHYQAKGILDLHGTQRPVLINFTLKIEGDTAKASGTALLDRTAFGVGSGEWAATDQIAANVSVNFAFSARRRP